MRKVIEILSVVILFVACATAPPDPTVGLEEVSFNKWVAEHAPNAVKMPSGIYIEYIERAPESSTTKPIVDTSWLEVNYTGRILNGTIFVSRSEAISRQLGDWLATTHWVPDYTYFSNYNAKYCRGMNLALLDMHPGDSVRVYIPTSLSYMNTVYNSAYLGEVSEYSSRPLYYDIRLKRIINDPKEHELKTVEMYASLNWGLAATDTLKQGAYWRKTRLCPNADTVALHATVDLNKSDLFLDGFMLGTTLDSVAKARGIWVSNPSVPYEPLSINVDAADQDSLVIKAIMMMRYGEEAEIVTISKRTSTGTEGDPSSTPQINPYSPRLYQIKLMPIDTAKKKHL